jgi:hemin uptake protein HemP
MTAARKPTPAAKPVKRIAVGDLLNGGREVVLLHDGDEYRLRLTSSPLRQKAIKDASQVEETKC